MIQQKLIQKKFDYLFFYAIIFCQLFYFMFFFVNVLQNYHIRSNDKPQHLLAIQNDFLIYLSPIQSIQWKIKETGNENIQESNRKSIDALREENWPQELGVSRMIENYFLCGINKITKRTKKAIKNILLTKGLLTIDLSLFSKKCEKCLFLRKSMKYRQKIRHQMLQQMILDIILFYQKFQQFLQMQSASSSVKQNKITHQLRKQLIHMVTVEKMTIKQAHYLLKINYSTAKMIMRKYKDHGKITKFKHETHPQPNIQTYADHQSTSQSQLPQSPQNHQQNHTPVNLNLPTVEFTDYVPIVGGLNYFFPSQLWMNTGLEFWNAMGVSSEGNFYNNVAPFYL